MKYINKCEWHNACNIVQTMTYSRDMKSNNCRKLEASISSDPRSTDCLFKTREYTRYAYPWYVKNSDVAQIELTRRWWLYPQPLIISRSGTSSVGCGSWTGWTFFEKWNGGVTLKSAISCTGRFSTQGSSVVLYVYMIVILCKLPPLFIQLDPART